MSEKPGVQEYSTRSEKIRGSPNLSLLPRIFVGRSAVPSIGEHSFHQAPTLTVTKLVYSIIRLGATLTIAAPFIIAQEIAFPLTSARVEHPTQVGFGKKVASTRHHPTEIRLSEEAVRNKKVFDPPICLSHFYYCFYSFFYFFFVYIASFHARIWSVNKSWTSRCF